jgi:hypothetical protein
VGGCRVLVVGRCGRGLCKTCLYPAPRLSSTLRIHSSPSICPENHRGGVRGGEITTGDHRCVLLHFRYTHSPQENTRKSSRKQCLRTGMLAKHLRSPRLGGDNKTYTRRLRNVATHKNTCNVAPSTLQDFASSSRQARRLCEPIRFGLAHDWLNSSSTLVSLYV